MNKINITVERSLPNTWRCTAPVCGVLVDREYWHMPKSDAIAQFRDFVAGVQRILESKVGA